MTEDENEKEIQVRAEFDEALKLRDAGQLDKAIAIMERLALKVPERASVVGTLAGLQWQAGDYASSAINGRATISLSPRSELASRTLFHALLDLGDLEGAFVEVARFRSIKQSNEYEQTLSEMEDGTLATQKNRPLDTFQTRVLELIRQELRARPLKQ